MPKKKVDDKVIGLPCTEEADAEISKLVKEVENSIDEPIPVKNNKTKAHSSDTDVTELSVKSSAKELTLLDFDFFKKPK